MRKSSVIRFRQLQSSLCGPEVSPKQMRRSHSCKMARTQRQCSKGWVHCKSRQRRQEWHRNTEPENTKNWRHKLQNWRNKNKESLFEKLEVPWRDTHNADPGGKKERMMTELTELTVTKNTPDLRTLVTTHQILGKEQPPREEKLGTQFRPQGTPNGERR